MLRENHARISLQFDLIRQTVKEGVTPRDKFTKLTKRNTQLADKNAIIRSNTDTTERSDHIGSQIESTTDLVQRLLVSNLNSALRGVESCPQTHILSNRLQESIAHDRLRELMSPCTSILGTLAADDPGMIMLL